MENWKDYIDDKFVPREQFIFTSEKYSNSLTITDKYSQTVIRFFWPSNNWATIANVQFFNLKSSIASVEFKEITFSFKDISALDRHLQPIFEKDWIIEHTYFFGKLWKSKTILNTQPRKTKITQYTSEFSFVSLLLFSVYEPFAGLIGQKKRLRIQAIKAGNCIKKQVLKEVVPMEFTSDLIHA
ncbi:MAG: hypothetical protein SFY56_14910 [Bacteroidota bacterium]|nr:hypothetical protein [Bacteroidota bacterium]